MPERLDSVSKNLQLWVEKISEHIALNVAAQAARKSRIRGNVETRFVASVSLKVHLEAQILVPAVNQRAVTAIQAVPLCVWAARGKTQGLTADVLQP